MTYQKENFENLIERMETYLKEKRYVEARETIIDVEPVDIAFIMESLPEDTIPIVFRLLPKELAAEVFVELEADSQEALIRGFSKSELKEVIDELYLDDAVDIIEEMPANVVRRILATADPETRTNINNILQYPEDSTGSIMTTEYIDLKISMTVEDALKKIRRVGQDMETINVMYVVDADRHLLGYVSIRTLLLADENDTMEELMDAAVISASTLDDQEETARKFEKYDFLTMPVVDKEKRLVGIVTIDDALDVLVEETTEDIEKMAAILPSEKEYLRSNALDLFKKRIPWLLLLMVSATFTGIIITRFENALAAQVVLTSFIPMLMDTGGNSGSQASVTVIRALSLGELEFKDLAVVIWKEIQTAVLCGFTLATACFLKIVLVDKILLGNTEITILVAFVVCATMALTVLMAKVIGCTLPMIANRLGFDPAVMSSPFITTIVDALSLLVYFTIASALLF